MTKAYLFDSNILIYILKGEEFYLDLLNKFEKQNRFVSTLSIFEVLNGKFKTKKDRDEALKFLSFFEAVVPNQDICQLASDFFQIRRKKSINLKPTIDFIIEATAINYNYIIVTANQEDFPEAKKKGLLFNIS